MSNEIQVQTVLSCSNGNFVFPPIGSPHSIDQANAGGGLPGFLIVDTAEEDITLTDLTTPGYLYIKNIGITGSDSAEPYITFGPKSSGSLVPFCELKIGEEACFRLTRTSATFRIKSSADSTGVQLCILED